MSADGVTYSTEYRVEGCKVYLRETRTVDGNASVLDSALNESDAAFVASAANTHFRLRHLLSLCAEAMQTEKPMKRADLDAILETIGGGNARLIAAAPSLLAVLKEARGGLAYTPIAHMAEVGKIIQRIDKVVAEAEKC